MDIYVRNGKLNADSIVIAHSLGTLFIPKYLAENNILIKLYISCAGFINDHSGREDLRKIVEDFSPSDEQISKAIELIANRYSIFSDNDHMNPQSELEYYANKFKANKIFIPNIGHMANVRELPQAIEIIKQYVGKRIEEE